MIKNKKIMAAFLTILLLIISNVFMTFAWYGHLKLQEMNISTSWPLIIIILVSWGLALLEYCFMVPANRIGSAINGGPFSLMQLKIIQEAISLTVFTVIVATVFKGEPIKWNHFVAFGFIILAVFFAFLNTGKDVKSAQKEDVKTEQIAPETEYPSCEGKV